MTLEEVLEEARSLITDTILFKEGFYIGLAQVWWLYIIVLLFSLVIATREDLRSFKRILFQVLPRILVANLTIIIAVSVIFGLGASSDIKKKELKEFKEKSLVSYMDKLPVEKSEISTLEFSESSISGTNRAKYLNTTKSTSTQLLVTYQDGKETKTVHGNIPVVIDYKDNFKTPYITYKNVPKDILPSAGITKGLYEVELHVPSNMHESLIKGFNRKES